MIPNTRVHDHGFVALRNLAGPTRRPDKPYDADDVDPANSARMSFDQMDKGRTAEEDHKLAGYLMKNWHTTPFEMIECWVEMKMPIFVARQFVRHRTVSINEVSARYVTLPGEWYIPEIVGAAPPKGGAKQGRVETLDPETQAWFKKMLDEDCAAGYGKYLEAMIRNVAPEQARCFLHVNHYTHWLWKQDLHNIMHFLRLRDHSHTQGESVDYARAVDGHIRTYLPKSMELYDEYRRQKEPADLDDLLKEFADMIQAEHDSAGHNGSYQGQVIAGGRSTLLRDIKTKLREAGLGK